MKVYVASRFTDWQWAAHLCVLLVAAGHEPTARWIDVARELDGECARVPVGDARRAHEAELDESDVERADAIIAIVPDSGGTGMWWELGFAKALGKRVMLIGCATTVLGRSIFCERREGIELFETAVSAVAALGGSR